MSYQLIVLDGPSCVGKTQLAKELQKQLPHEVWLNFSIDTIVYTLPQIILDGCNYENKWDTFDRNALLAGTFSCVQSLVNCGNKVIFDNVVSTERRASELLGYLNEFRVFYVGLTAEWECLEQRVNEREDRTLAEVKHGYETAPKHLPYDILVDTTQCDPASVAKEVIRAMTLKA
ncbi:TPA: AAA family ATPase [Vibrio parahaemolyticus]|uniref:phosphotransferase-like protein n=1 Tax=Vibrio parahaemolyticus TaxID=670 RepID=UPI001A1CE007|nr:AAA family ATPase [Vibrio parahaemolyticus]EHH1260001.1 AAA family ATPase [Vibrio parahaemolyticus]WMP11112.1 chloramphenicol phosphotransferase CPT family protein [Vibrio parahaemolyticus]HAS3047193.1 AAA family ATPase [Vibrio parahaemolyticus]